MHGKSEDIHTIGECAVFLISWKYGCSFGTSLDRSPVQDLRLSFSYNKSIETRKENTLKITEFNKLGLQYLDFPAYMNEINRQFSRNQDWHDQPVQDVERIVMCCPTEPGETFNTSERPLVQLPVTVENLKQSGMAWEMLYKDKYEHCPDDTVVYNNTFFQKNVKGKSQG